VPAAYPDGFQDWPPQVKQDAGGAEARGFTHRRAD